MGEIQDRVPADSTIVNHFASQVASHRPERDEGIHVAIHDIRELARGFAEAMIQQSMPADHIRLEEYDSPADRRQEPQLLRSATYPAWIALQDTDLSGRTLVCAEKEIETYSTSLGSGRRNNSRTKYKSITPKKLSELRPRADIIYAESGIAITGLGNMVAVSKYYQGKASGYPRMLPPFQMDASDLEPEDLFDTEASINPTRVIAEMRKRLDKQAMHYERVRQKDTSGTNYHSPDYYQPTENPIAPRAAQPVASKKSWFKRG